MSLTTDISVGTMTKASQCFTRSIWAGVRFGMPGKNCAGSGICEVYAIGGGGAKSRCGCLQLGQITANGSDQVVFRFLNNALRPLTKKKYFQSDYFLIEEEYVLPAYLQKALGLKSDTLATGWHAIRYEGDYVSILIRLKK